MLKKYLPIGLLAAAMLAGQLSAQQSSGKPAPVARPAAANAATDGITDRMVPIKVASQTVKADPVVLTNQMMLVFMERMKTGNLKEARDIANEMVFGNEKFQDTDQKVFKSFHSAMEMELFKLLEQRSDQGS